VVKSSFLEGEKVSSHFTRHVSARTTSFLELLLTESSSRRIA